MGQKNTLCSGINCYTPEHNYHEGCEVLNKIRHVVVPKGVAAVVEWQLRHPTGDAVDLTECFPTESVSVSESATDNDHVIRARFSDCDGGVILERDGAVSDASTGKVLFAIPKGVYNESGIYVMSMGVVDKSSGTPLFLDSGLLSIETSLWGDVTKRTAPPTLSDIRNHIRDTPLENDELLSDVEFDVSEIIQAIVWPIREWNEKPPPLAPFTCRTFPFRFHWMRAVVSELLRTAAHHYMRNNLKINHGGVSGNFKDKYQEYLEVSQLYRQEWLTFLEQKKAEININGGFASLDSPYSDGWGF